MPVLIPAAPFRDISIPIDLCQLPIDADEFETRTGLTMALEDADLGPERFLFASLGAVTFLFLSRPSGPPGAQLVGVSVLSYEPDPPRARAELLAALGFTSDQLPWSAELEPPGRWALWRLDDNGNEIEMMRFPDERRASLARAWYERRGHKQSYSVRAAT